MTTDVMPAAEGQQRLEVARQHRKMFLRLATEIEMALARNPAALPPPLRSWTYDGAVPADMARQITSERKGPNRIHDQQRLLWYACFGVLANQASRAMFDGTSGCFQIDDATAHRLGALEFPIERFGLCEGLIRRRVVDCMRGAIEDIRRRGPGFAHLVHIVEDFLPIARALRPEERYASLALMLDAVEYSAIGIPLLVAEVTPRLLIRAGAPDPTLDEVDRLARGSGLFKLLASGSADLLTAAAGLVADCNAACFEQDDDGVAPSGLPPPVHPINTFHRSYPTRDHFTDLHKLHAPASERWFVIETTNGHATVEAPALLEAAAERVRHARPHWATIGCPALHQGLVARYKDAMLDVARHPLLWGYELQYLREG